MFQGSQECAGSFAWTSDACVAFVLARADQVDRTCDFSAWNDMRWINSRLGWNSCRSFAPGGQAVHGSRSTPPDKGRTHSNVDTSTLTGLQLSQNTAPQRLAGLVQMSSTADMPPQGSTEVYTFQIHQSFVSLVCKELHKLIVPVLFCWQSLEMRIGLMHTALKSFWNKDWNIRFIIVFPVWNS